MREALALAGAVMTIVALLPYMWDVLQKRTKPNIVSWFTWGLLTSIATAAAFSAGEYEAALLAAANAFGTLSIVLLGIKNGYSKFTWFDGASQTGALITLAIWMTSDNPAIAIVGVVLIDMFGVATTLKHSWERPTEETLVSYIISFTAPIFTLLSLQQYNIENTLYTAYLGLADGLVAAVIYYRRKHPPLTLTQKIFRSFRRG